VLRLISADVFEAIGVCPVEYIGVAARVAAPHSCGPVTSMVQAAGARSLLRSTLDWSNTDGQTGSPLKLTSA
jgi:hypothetical protein